MDIDALSQDIERETGIVCAPTHVERILTAVTVTNDYWDIIRLSRQPVPVVSSTLRFLMEKGYVDQNLRITEKGAKEIKAIGTWDTTHYTCDKCEGRGLDLDLWSDVLVRFKEIVRDRPEAIQEFDQGYVTPETSVARLMLADARGDLKERDIFIIGDDDLVSLAALLSQRPRSVTVLEIDPRIIGFIEKWAERLGGQIETITVDIREPLPPKLLGRFHTFFTDPPETHEALRLFIGRGIASLRGEGCAGYFGLTTAESSVWKRLKLQRFLCERGVVITDIIPYFNHYVNWDYYANTPAFDLSPTKMAPTSIWYMSDQYRIETARGYWAENNKVEGDIYLDRESSTK